MKTSNGRFALTAIDALSLVEVGMIISEVRGIFVEVATLMDLMSESKLSGEDKKSSVLSFLKGFWRYGGQSYDAWVVRISQFIDSIHKVVSGVVSIKLLIKTMC